jgi:hypothetical protein
MERTSPAPFYQVRVNDQEMQQQQQQQQQLRASPETVSAPPMAQPPWANGYPKSHNYREIFPAVEDDNLQQDVKGGWKNNGDVRDSPEPTHQYPPGGAPWDFLRDEEEEALRAAEGKSEPLLNVDIPDVQMERYSVMFGSLLGKGGSWQTLLARRSKHLEMLKTQKEEVCFNSLIIIIIISLFNPNLLLIIGNNSGLNLPKIKP